MWHIVVLYPSTELKLPIWCTDEDDICGGPRLHGDFFIKFKETGLSLARSFKLSRGKKHERHDGA
jgi:hypothetical protein